MLVEKSTANTWLDIWNCMVKECKEEMVLLTCTLLVDTVEGKLMRKVYFVTFYIVIDRDIVSRSPAFGRK